MTYQDLFCIYIARMKINMVLSLFPLFLHFILQLNRFVLINVGYHLKLRIAKTIYWEYHFISFYFKELIQITY
jgi:hypothetical protein